MRIVTTDKNLNTDTSVDSILSSSVAESTPFSHKSYHELADKPVVETDALAQLHVNLEMLQDLQSRLSFVMREVRYLIKV